MDQEGPSWAGVGARGSSSGTEEAQDHMKAGREGRLDSQEEAQRPGHRLDRYTGQLAPLPDHLGQDWALSFTVWLPSE
jgi:hypothetical protein